MRRGDGGHVAVAALNRREALAEGGQPPRGEGQGRRVAVEAEQTAVGRSGCQQGRGMAARADRAVDEAPARMRLESGHNLAQ